MTSTYSFADVSLTLNHPSVGTFTLTGQGVGSMSLSYANDNTQHDVSADGSVMVSKILTNNGSMALAIQQTSEANLWLQKWISYLKAAPTNEWARTTGVLKNAAMNEVFNLKGISPQKRPDRAYQTTGQQVTWNMLIAEITE